MARSMGMSSQEEETLALAAIEKLGEPTAHQVALELGVDTVRHTLGRLVHQGRVVCVRDRQAVNGMAPWVYQMARKDSHAARPTALA